MPVKYLWQCSEEWENEDNPDPQDLQLLAEQLCKALESRSNQESRSSQESRASSRMSGASYGTHDMMILVCS